MGIVVTVFMLLAVCCWRPGRRLGCPGGAPGRMAAARPPRRPGRQPWNLFWHGLRHPGMFWGIAALVSGPLTDTAAIHLLRRPGATDGADARPGTALSATLLMTGLAACFLLYAVTLVRLNLDLPIIGT